MGRLPVLVGGGDLFGDCGGVGAVLALGGAQSRGGCGSSMDGVLGRHDGEQQGEVGGIYQQPRWVGVLLGLSFWGELGGKYLYGSNGLVEERRMHLLVS